jgi:hypothetical protein
VESGYGLPAEAWASFHTTRWTVVLKRRRVRSQEGSRFVRSMPALWYPLCAFARRRGHSPDDAQDLTQTFFLHLLKHRALCRQSSVQINTQLCILISAV